MKERGSVLIASLWAISVFSVFISSLAFEGAQHALLMKREIQNLETKSLFLSALNLTSQKIFSDPLPHEDSQEEEWYGEVKLAEPWKDKVSVKVEDEESKLNLNSASEAFLKSFLTLFEEEVDSLKGERKDIVKQITKARQKQRIASLEELYLLEDLEKEDIEKLKPYLTVYPDLPQININTVHPIVLKALIESLPGDDLAKEELTRKIIEFREKKEKGVSQAFQSKDLEPNPFLERLGLNPSLQMMALANQFLPFVTVDSRIYRLKLQAKSGKEAQAVIREKSEGFEMEVLNWHEE